MYLFFFIIIASILAGYFLLTDVAGMDVSQINMGDVKDLLGDFCDGALSIGNAMWEAVAELVRSMPGGSDNPHTKLDITCDDIPDM